MCMIFNVLVREEKSYGGRGCLVFPPTPLSTEAQRCFSVAQSRMGRCAEQGCVCVCLSLRHRAGAPNRAPRCHHVTCCGKAHLLCWIWPSFDMLIVWENQKVFFYSRKLERGLRGKITSSLSPPFPLPHHFLVLSAHRCSLSPGHFPSPGLWRESPSPIQLRQLGRGEGDHRQDLQIYKLFTK